MAGAVHGPAVVLTPVTGTSRILHYFCLNNNAAVNVYPSQFDTYRRFSQSPLTLDNAETRTRQRACQNLTDQSEFT